MRVALLVLLPFLGSASSSAPDKDKHGGVEDHAHKSARTRIPHPQPNGSLTPEQRAQQYAGAWGPHVRNMSDWQEWRDAYMKKYANTSMHFAREADGIAKGFKDAPASAKDCHTLKALRAWRDAQLAPMKAYIPKAFRGLSEAFVMSEFKANEARIKAEEKAAKSSNGTSAHRDAEPAVLVEFPAQPNDAGSFDGERTAAHASAEGATGASRPLRASVDGRETPAGLLEQFVGQWMPRSPSFGGLAPAELGQQGAGDRAPRIRDVNDTREWRETLMDDYADAYKRYAHETDRIADEFGDAPQHASDCYTLRALRKWRGLKLARIDAFVPETFQGTAKKKVGLEFESNEARILEAEKLAKLANRTKAVDTLPQDMTLLEEPAVQLAGVAPSGHNQSTPRSPDQDKHGGAEDHAHKFVRTRIPHPQPNGSLTPEQRAQQYASGWGPHVRNMSDGQEWRDAYMKKYAKAFMHFASDANRIAKGFKDAPASAKECHTLKALRAWRDAQLAPMEAYIPKTFRGPAEASIVSQFKANEARIKAEEKAAKSSNGTSAHRDVEPAVLVELSAQSDDAGASDHGRTAAAHSSADEASRPRHAADERHETAVDLLNQYVSQWIPHSPSFGSLDLEQLKRQDDIDRVPRIHDVRDAREWRDALMDDYADADKHYSRDTDRIADEFSDAPQHASDCHTLKTLREWRGLQLARIDAFVPATFQDTSKDNVELEFKAHAARILEAEKAAKLANRTEVGDMLLQDMTLLEEPAVQPGGVASSGHDKHTSRSENAQEWHDLFMDAYADAYRHYARDQDRIMDEFHGAPKNAKDCKTLEALGKWRSLQLVQIKAFVPKTFRSSAERHVESEFKANGARIKAEEKAAGPSNGTSAHRDVEPAVLVGFPAQPNNTGSSDGERVAVHSSANKDARASHQLHAHEERREAPADFLKRYISQWIPHPRSSGGPAPEQDPWQYAGDWVPRTGAVRDAQGWRDALMADHADAYKRYANDMDLIAKKSGGAPQHARDCRTPDALRKWRGLQLARVDAFVPATFQAMAKEKVELEYKSNEARLQKVESLNQQVNGSVLSTAGESDTPASLFAAGATGVSTILSTASFIFLTAFVTAASACWTARGRCFQTPEDDLSGYYIQV